jgi:hypothetical protein
MPAAFFHVTINMVLSTIRSYLMFKKKQRSSEPNMIHGADNAIHGLKSLTDEQKETVKDIFAKYDIQKLSNVEAKIIFKKINEAGIRGSGVSQALKYVGMDAGKFLSLVYDGKRGGASGSW